MGCPARCESGPEPAWTARGTRYKDTSERLAPFNVPADRFTHINVDLVGPLPASCGFTYLFTVMERFTRWPEAFPLTSMHDNSCHPAGVDLKIRGAKQHHLRSWDTVHQARADGPLQSLWFQAPLHNRVPPTSQSLHSHWSTGRATAAPLHRPLQGARTGGLNFGEDVAPAVHRIRLTLLFGEDAAPAVGR